MAKYELKKRTEVSGAIWYSIVKDGDHIDSSFTTILSDAEKMLEEFSNGKQTKPIVETLKTIEIDEN